VKEVLRVWSLGPARVDAQVAISHAKPYFALVLSAPGLINAPVTSLSLGTRSRGSVGEISNLSFHTGLILCTYYNTDMIKRNETYVEN